MALENTEVIHRWFEEVWNKTNENAIDELFAEDGLAHGLGKEPIRGPEGFKLLFRAFMDSFADISATVHRVIADGDIVAMQCSVSMTHKGTGKTAEFSGGGFARIQDGQIVEAWNVWDFMGYFAETGCLPDDVMERCLAGQVLQ